MESEINGTSAPPKPQPITYNNAYSLPVSSLDDLKKIEKWNLASDAKVIS